MARILELALRAIADIEEQCLRHRREETDLARRMGQRPDGMSLHEACYQGKLDVVAQLLASGADPNEPADPSGPEWISCAGGRPKPLNCVAIAWTMTENHMEIARLLIEHGAVVDDSVLGDHTIKVVGGAADFALRRILEAARRS